MILDSLKNCALYENVNPRMKKAFALIASTDWTKMEPGIHELDGKDIYVNVMERELKAVIRLGALLGALIGCLNVLIYRL